MNLNWNLVFFSKGIWIAFFQAIGIVFFSQEGFGIGFGFFFQNELELDLDFFSEKYLELNLDFFLKRNLNWNWIFFQKGIGIDFLKKGIDPNPVS